MYAEYSDYTGAYKGRMIPEASFAEYELRAAESVNLITRNRAKDAVDAALLPSVKLATCAAADVLYMADQVRPGAQIVSETTGAQSETRAAAYQNMDAWQKGTDSRVYGAVRAHLMWTGMMYSGVSVQC